ncbi:MAG: SIR2 family protein [Bacteroidales bacterium]|nr:SIR2 family protein [Bacteroidales bacterium]
MDTELDIINSESNKESKEKFQQLMETGYALIFVGSGSSCLHKYPTWKELLIDFNNIIENEEDRNLINFCITNEQFLLAAEMIKYRLNTETFANKFQKIFDYKTEEFGELHRTIVDLKCKGFVTTNYDPVIFAALTNYQGRKTLLTVVSEITKREIHNFIKSLTLINSDNRQILYLHGIHYCPNNSVLCYSDYLKMYNGVEIRILKEYEMLVNGKMSISQFEAYIDLEKTKQKTTHYNTYYLLCATQRIVYIGYGLRDPFLNKITDEIKNDFAPIYDDFHFALVSQNDIKGWSNEMYYNYKQAWSRKGIELVVFQDDESFSGLQRFLESLSPMCRISKPHDSVNGVEQIEIEKKESVTSFNTEINNDEILTLLNQRTVKTIKEIKEL